jgi:thiamine transport system substrate-binding protein
MHHPIRRAGAGLTAAALTLGALTACSQSEPPAQPTSPGVVRLVTHDSFAVSDDVLAAFTAQTGLSVEILPSDDAGTMVNQLILTKEAPIGDVVYGIDNSFASRAVTEGILQPYTSPAGGEEQASLAAEDSGSLTAVDFSDVCVNLDHRYFTEASLAEPVTLEDLARPEYAELLVVENPATSSPGLAFMLATIAAFGQDGWLEYWQQLVDGGVSVTNGWTEAYVNAFSGPSSTGSKPLVVSYASSPPSEIPEGESTPATGALLQTCFRQVEYAGLLTGAANPEGGRQLIDFFLSEAFQTDIPGQMWVYPASAKAQLPADWAAFAPLADEPWVLPAADIAEGRERWLREWNGTVLG